MLFLREKTMIPRSTPEYVSRGILRGAFLVAWLFACSAGCNVNTFELTDPPQPPTRQAPPSEIRILAWNVESGGNDPAVIASQLKNELRGYDIYALSEVAWQSTSIYADAVKESSQTNALAFESESGGDDRLVFLINGDRFEVIGSEELDRFGDYRLNDGNHRSVMVFHLLDKTTGQDFKITNNHFARRDERLREEQASGLREWARVQTVPTIAVGDYNLDYDFVKHEGNAQFATMLRDNVWKWVQPEEWIDTQWSGADVDRYPDSMLDFAFVAGPAKEWDLSCRVIKRPEDFPDSDETSDHRPVELVVAK